MRFCDIGLGDMGFWHRSNRMALARTRWTASGSGTIGVVGIYPRKLRPDSQVRVIAPSRSLGIIGADVRTEADRRLRDVGLRVSFGDHVEDCDDFLSSSVEDRLADLHQAFADPDVDGILTVIGGFNSNQLLTGIDYALIEQNPKPLCGFSDITALGNALYARCGLVTYSGPHYSTFGMKRHFEYTEGSFLACLFDEEPVAVVPSAQWSDDQWFLDQDDRDLVPNPGWWVLNGGEASGTIIGGNLCTLNLLQGTRFMPSLDGSVVFVEDDAQVRPWDFDRDLVSLLQQPGFSEVRGIVIGRFQKASAMTRQLLEQIVATKPELSHLPVLANVDFGHTSPMITFPIGGLAELDADPVEPRLVITRH